jgi:amino-acid N-acetyltransferase
LRIDIEALLTTGVPNTPMAGARVRVASGNFVVAQPRGVRSGVDFEHTGEVRRIEAAAIRQHLEQGEIVLLSPLGYSPTGETFNLSNEDVATAAAIALRADKLVFLTESRLADAHGTAVTQLSPADAEAMLTSKKGPAPSLVPVLRGAIRACGNAVPRVHLVPRALDGGLLIELYTRDGAGTLVTAQGYESLRPAIIDDVGGILELIAPLETGGTLVRRSREQLELEIRRFEVIERDGMVIGCAALYPYVRDGVGELACLAIHPDYRGEGRGDALLHRMEVRAVEQKLRRIFVLTTQTSHWFREHGFTAGDIAKLPVERQSLYNWQRNSKVFIKKIAARRR